MNNFVIEPIGYVEASREKVVDDFWGGEKSSIVLVDEYEPEALSGLDSFSHVEVLFLFNQVDPKDIVTGVRHPRNNKEWPAIGIFAQRGKNRPNRIGSTISRIVGLDGNRLIVAELDAIDGTPVLDLKPIMTEFLPREDVLQPRWSHELMADYWKER